MAEKRTEVGKLYDAADSIYQEHGDILRSLPESDPRTIQFRRAAWKWLVAIYNGNEDEARQSVQNEMDDYGKNMTCALMVSLYG